MYASRTEAGQRLVPLLAEMGLQRPIVFALPRGGVPVAIPVAAALGAPLELVMVRKIGTPGAEELVMGAIAEGEETVVNEDIYAAAASGRSYLEHEAARQRDEMARRARLYLSGHARADPAGRCAILVDDGLATGATMKAALAAIRRRGAAETVVAVPVAPPRALDEIARLADRVVCPWPAEGFRGVGQFYREFHQLSDEETIALLRAAWARPDHDWNGGDEDARG
ncbi:phosphoribosyltransferase family protein [uncultured Limimaricola sp.]|uniref:phosphoribosyltransferase n=1 Tax=uncultured Limimaricola sp. TaxID=2211667 RepID=UPI0030F80A02